MTSGSSFLTSSWNAMTISFSLPVIGGHVLNSPFSYTTEQMQYRKSCSTLFSMSKDRNLRPGSNGSMFSKEPISMTMSVRYSPSHGSPVTLMHAPMSRSYMKRWLWDMSPDRIT